MSLEVGSIQVLAALFTAIAAALVMRVVIPTPRRLRHRVQPYTSPTLAGLARGDGTQGLIRSVFGPIIRDAADWLGALIDRTGSGVSSLKLRQSGWFRGVPEEDLVPAYRVIQLRSVAAAGAVSLAVGQLIDAPWLIRLLLAGLGLLVGASRPRGRLDKAIESRRETMKIEIYTINQLLAMRVRTGGGVAQAVRAVTRRGQGEVVSELKEALRLHRTGWAGPDAFRRIAELTAEPFCARTYRLLAAAEERGADLAGALLSLSEDVRETRRESIKRTATKRRAAMLVPTIAILAPVLILFVAAPLPYLITSWQ